MDHLWVGMGSNPGSPGREVGVHEKVCQASGMVVCDHELVRPDCFQPDHARYWQLEPNLLVDRWRFLYIWHYFLPLAKIAL